MILCIVERSDKIKEWATSAEIGKVLVLSSNGLFSLDLSKQSLSDGNILNSTGQDPTFVVIYSGKMGDLTVEKPETAAKSWSASTISITTGALEKASKLAHTARACFSLTFLPKEHHFADRLSQFTNKLQTIEKLYESHFLTTTEGFTAKIQEIVKKVETQRVITMFPDFDQPFANFLKFPGMGPNKSLTDYLEYLAQYPQFQKKLTEMGWKFDNIDYEDRIRSIEDGIMMIERYRAELASLTKLNQVDAKFVGRCQKFLSEWSASTVRSMSRCPRRALLLAKNAPVYNQLEIQTLQNRTHSDTREPHPIITWVNNAYDVASVLSMCLNVEKIVSAWDKTRANAPAAFYSLTTNRLRQFIPPDLLKQFRNFIADSFESEVCSQLPSPWCSDWENSSYDTTSTTTSTTTTTTTSTSSSSSTTKSAPTPPGSLKEAIKNLSNVSDAELQHLYELAESAESENKRLNDMIQTLLDYRTHSDKTNVTTIEELQKEVQKLRRQAQVS